MINNNPTHLIINTDGGSRGNPGPAAIGVKITLPDGSIFHQISQQIGITTNNIAEYTAVKEALSFLSKKFKEKTCEVKVSFYLDSELVVRQLTGIYKIKEPTLATLANQIQQLKLPFSDVTFTHVRRELNKDADLLVNMALDNKPL